MILLTKYMVGDFLESRGIRTRILGMEPWKFSGFSAEGVRGSDHSLLYVVGEEEAGPAGRASSCVLRFFLDAAHFSGTFGEREEILCLADEAEAVKALADCFAFYKDWYIGLLEELSGGANLQKLIDLSLPVFDNPISISDNGFQILAVTREYYGRMEDDESRYLCQNGFHTPAYISRITHHEAFLENYRSNLGPYRYHYDFLEHESIYCTIWLRGRPVGYLTIVGMNSVAGRSKVDAARILAEVLSRAFAFNTGSRQDASVQENLLLNVLRGSIEGSSVAKDVQNCLHLDEGESFRVFRIKIDGTHADNCFLLSRVQETLAGKVRKGTVLPEENGYTVVLSEKGPRPEALVGVLTAIFSGCRIRLGASYADQALSALPLLYRQADTCADALADREGERILSYEYWMVRDVLRNALTPKEKAAAVHPAVRRLSGAAKVDGEAGRSGAQLMETLSAYVLASGNGTAAAAALHIHKNTLYYRLRKIEEQTGLDLADGELADCLRISLLLLEAEETAGL